MESSGLVLLQAMNGTVVCFTNGQDMFTLRQVSIILPLFKDGSDNIRTSVGVVICILKSIHQPLFLIPACFALFFVASVDVCRGYASFCSFD